MVRQWMCVVMLAWLGCTTRQEPPPPPAEVGELRAVRAGDGIDVTIDVSTALLTIAATVRADGVTLSEGTPGAAVDGRNLFSQKAQGGQVRFAVGDSRKVAMQRQGVLIHIPVTGTLGNVVINEVSAATTEGTTVIVRGFEGNLGAAP